MADTLFRDTQDFHRFALAYREQFPDDVLTLSQPLSADQDVTAVVAELAARGQHPMLVCEQVEGIATPLVTNFFASRSRIGRLFGVEASGPVRCVSATCQQSNRTGLRFTWSGSGTGH